MSILWLSPVTVTTSNILKSPAAGMLTVEEPFCFTPAEEPSHVSASSWGLPVRSIPVIVNLWISFAE